MVMAANMDKIILAVVDEFGEWKGNAYTLANLIAEKQKEIDKETLLNAGFIEASEAI